MDSSGNIPVLYIVCDMSGSMNESCGKFLLMRGVIRAVEQFFRLGYGHADLKTIFWNSKVNLPDWDFNNGIPAQITDCYGKANINMLRDYLALQSAGKMLILSDGWFDLNDLVKWGKALPHNTLKIIKIGSDANPLLKGEGVFSPDDLFLALDKWLPCVGTKQENITEDEW